MLRTLFPRHPSARKDSCNGTNCLIKASWERHDDSMDCPKVSRESSRREYDTGSKKSSSLAMMAKKLSSLKAPGPLKSTLNATYLRQGVDGEDQAVLRESFLEFQNVHHQHTPTLASFHGIFDGYKGSDSASFLAAELQEYLKREIHEQEDEDTNRCDTGTTPSLTVADLEAALHDAFMRADEAYRLRIARDDDVSGSSVIVALMCSPNDTLVLAHMGTCRAVMYRDGDEGGQCIQLTQDHIRFTNKMEECRIQSVLDKSDFDGQLCLTFTRTFGAFEQCVALPEGIVLNEPEICSVRIEPEHRTSSFIILASSGLWNVLTNAQACEIVSQCLFVKAENRPDVAVMTLVKHASKLSDEDISASVICWPRDGGEATRASVQQTSKTASGILQLGAGIRAQNRSAVSSSRDSSLGVCEVSEENHGQSHVRLTATNPQYRS